MNEMTITQISGIVAILYTFYQMSQARAEQASIVADISARLANCENQMQAGDRAWARIERNMSDIATAIARLEERVSALDSKIDRDRDRGR